MTNKDDDWFAGQVALAHAQGRIPHGAVLPDTMPWTGDFFVLENEDGTDTLYTWWEGGHWNRGPTLARPVNRP